MIEYPHFLSYKYRCAQLGTKHKPFRLTLRDRVLAFLIHWSYWEFWNQYFLYIPMIALGTYYTFRSGTFFFFSKMNPGIRFSGALGDSKYEIDKILPAEYKIATFFLAGPAQSSAVLALMQTHQLSFPVILKADIGRRGAGVSKVSNLEEIEAYLSTHHCDIIVQSYVDYFFELGVFYYRMPGESEGHISSMCLKCPLHVVGSNQHSVGELMRQNHRMRNYLPLLYKKNNALLDYVPAVGEVVLINKNVFNHSQGSVFSDSFAHVTPKISQFFDKLSKQIPGFYYGRYDIRCRSLADLEQGKHVKIIELNGLTAEPAHIYDPSTTLLRAYREIDRHYAIANTIGRANMKSVYLTTALKRAFFVELWQLLSGKK